MFLHKTKPMEENQLVHHTSLFQMKFCLIFQVFSFLRYFIESIFYHLINNLEKLYVFHYEGSLKFRNL